MALLLVCCKLFDASVVFVFFHFFLMFLGRVHPRYLDLLLIFVSLQRMGVIDIILIFINYRFSYSLVA